MKRFLNRRMLGLVGIVAVTQLLSACIVVPPRGYRQRTVVVEPAPYYSPGPGRDWRDRDRDHDRRDWDGHR
jgi:hypothetical protein